MCLSIGASLGFSNLTSLDVSAAFLQAEPLTRSVYAKFPKFIECDENYVYKLHNPLYGLSDAGRQFYLKLKKILKENRYISTLGDECFS
jgi:hypothetical protein